MPELDGNRTNSGPGEILPGNLVWQSLEALKLEVPASVWNHHYDLVWSAMKLQADEIERLRKAGDELYLACIPAHDMLLDLGASTKVPVVAEQAGPIRRALDEAMQPWREAAIRE